MRRRFVGAAATLSIIGVACSSSSDDRSDAGPAASTTVALAPSQLTASTVARPETPPPCDAGDLAWWTAQAAPVGATSTAVLRVRNDGDVWCEVDISGSPSLGDTEPNVWLEPGEWADAIVASTSDRCSPTVADGVDVAVGDETVRVPSLLVVACAPTIVAFYVSELPTAACSELDAVAVDGAVLVRNAGFESCLLGEVVDGVSAGDSDGIEVVGLAGGDVAAIPVVAVGGECATATPTVRFESGAEVPVADADGCVVAGPVRPWFPTIDLTPSDPDDVVAVLSVFG